MTKSTANFILLSVAVIWGSGFIAQRIVSEGMGPNTFNALRFGAGGLILFLIFSKQVGRAFKKGFLPSAALIGALLFVGALFQQIGIKSTSAGKSGFITGLYIIIIPFLEALFFQKPVPVQGWIGAFVALIGLFVLSAIDNLTIGAGDFWTIGCAFCFALHVIAISRVSQNHDPIALSCLQYVFCAVLASVPAMLFETINPDRVSVSFEAVLYSAFFPVTLAYTAQVVAQKYTSSVEAGIILSLESVSAALLGALLLGELFTGREYVGSALMLAGVVVSQVNFKSIEFSFLNRKGHRGV